MFVNHPFGDFRFFGFLFFSQLGSEELPLLSLLLLLPLLLLLLSFLFFLFLLCFLTFSSVCFFLFLVLGGRFTVPSYTISRELDLDLGDCFIWKNGGLVDL